RPALRARPARAGRKSPHRRHLKRTKKIRGAGFAFVHLSGRLSASAYSRSVGLRPTCAPCSAQAGLYAGRGPNVKRVRRRIPRKLRTVLSAGLGLDEADEEDQACDEEDDGLLTRHRRAREQAV